MRPVRKVSERGRKVDLQPALVGVPRDRVIAPGGVPLAVCGQEQPGGVPPLPPLRLGQPGGGQVQPGAHQLPAAPRHRHRPRRDPPLDPGEARLQRLEPDRFGVPFRLSRVPGHAPLPPPDGDGQARRDRPDSRLQGAPLGGQVPVTELPGVLAGPGDRPGPPRRRQAGQRPLAHRPRRSPAPGVQPALRAAGGQVTARQRAQVSAGSSKDLSIPGRHPKPRPHPHPCRDRREGHGPDGQAGGAYQYLERRAAASRRCRP